MKRLLLVLLVLGASPAFAQESIVDHIAHERAILDAAEAVLVPKGPVYTSLSDHTVKPKPAPPALGPAGFAFTDPTFGSPMWRVTDASTSSGSSIRVPSNTHTAAWNSDGTKFLAMNESGSALVFGFDGTAVTKLAETVSSQIEPTFSYVDPNLVFGAVVHKVRTTRIDTGATADIVDLDAAYPQLPLTDTYIGGVLTTDGDKWIAFFGGTGQDRHVFVHHSTAGLLDLRTSGYKLHSAALERSGRYVMLYPANDPDLGHLAPGVSPIYVWDTQTGAVTPETVRGFGHDSVGYGVQINADCCTSTTWDASQWQVRSLTALNTATDLIPSVLTPQEIYLSEHSSWRAARPDVRVPFVSASYRFGDGVLHQTWYPWRAWDEEIIAVATDGTGKVWRFAHTQTLVGVNAEFWAQPIVHVSPDGRRVIFTSNWGVLGGRQDVFLVTLR